MLLLIFIEIVTFKWYNELLFVKNKCRLKIKVSFNLQKVEAL